MTREELSQVNRLNREIERDRRKLEALEWKLSAPQLFSGRGSAARKEAQDRLPQQISELRASIAEKQLKCARAETALTLYINDIEDSRTRILLRLRYVDGASWNEIAEVVPGTLEANKRYCNRQLKRLGVTE